MRRAINTNSKLPLLTLFITPKNESPISIPVVEPLEAEPESDTLVEDAPQLQSTPPGGSGSKYRVILYDDDHHGQEEVAAQLQKATQYSLQKCWAIMMEANDKGRAICFHGAREKCHSVTKVLRQIRLQCEVDCDD